MDQNGRRRKKSNFDRYILCAIATGTLGWITSCHYLPKASGIFLIIFSSFNYLLCIATYLYNRGKPPSHSPPPGFINPILTLYAVILLSATFSTIPMAIAWGTIYGIKNFIL